MKYFDLKKAAILKQHTNWYFSIDLQDYGGDSIYRKFDEFPSETDWPKIKAITFSISRNEKDGVKRLPSFISKLENLRSLGIPLDWANKLEIPKKIEALRLLSPIDDETVPIDWPENLVLDNLIFLQISAKPGNYNLDRDKFRNLEWISYDFHSMPSSKINSVILELSEIKNIRHLIFSEAKNVDIFTPFCNHDIQTLELFCCRGRKFEIGKIRAFKNLKHLYLNNIGTTTFDCKLLDYLPDLIELNLLNVKNVININHVLAHKKLKILIIRNCRNPFQNEDTKDFETRNYEHLDISRA